MKTRNIFWWMIAIMWSIALLSCEGKEKVDISITHLYDELTDLDTGEKIPCEGVEIIISSEVEISRAYIDIELLNGSKWTEEYIYPTEDIVSIKCHTNSNKYTSAIDVTVYDVDNNKYTKSWKR